MAYDVVVKDGLIVDGTCDELGRRCCWVLLDADGPINLTLACDPFAIASRSFPWPRTTSAGSTRW